MKILVIYLGLAVAGYAAAVPLRNKKEKFGFIGTLLMVLVRGLVFLMGLRIGSNSEVVGNLASIGFQSLIIAVLSLTATVAATHVLRRVMGFDRYGQLSTEQSGETDLSKRNEPAKGSAHRILNKSTVTMIVSVLTGFIAGFVLILRTQLLDYDTVYNISGELVTWGLYGLVFFVGMDMSFDGTIVSIFRQNGLKVLIFPMVTAVVTVVTVLVCSMFTPLNLKEAIAVACTFGWYSLGPNIMMDAGMVFAGSYCFLVNFLRVMLSLITIPVVAEKVGYLETVGMPCAAGMDVCIATTSQATNTQTVVYAFASGVVFTAAVPLLVPLITG
ncbi:MAG: lysine exporter LysO family protein [Firmicutes bacterium]|nr:lysine exporter LysO family protein [Bacillota bacterium]